MSPTKKFEYFLAIVDEGGLTKAAEKLFIAQPSLSQYLKRLEESIGVKLFDRNTSPLRLTYAGQKYYRYAQQMVTLEKNIQREFQDLDNQTSGDLRLGIALWRGACLLPDVFPDFHSKYPNIHLILTEGPANVMESCIMNEKIDLAIMNTHQGLDSSKLTIEKIYEERILLAIPSSSPVIEKFSTGKRNGGYPVISIEVLTYLPIIMTKPGQNLTKQIRYALSNLQIEPNILLEFGNLTTAINLAARGMGCAFVPEEGAKVCQHPGKITYFAVDSPHLVWDLSAVYKRDIYLPNIARLLIDEIKETFQNGGGFVTSITE